MPATITGINQAFKEIKNFGDEAWEGFRTHLYRRGLQGATLKLIGIEGIKKALEKLRQM